MKYDPNSTQALRRRATEAAERQARYLGLMLTIEILGFVMIIALELLR